MNTKKEKDELQKDSEYLSQRLSEYKQEEYEQLEYDNWRHNEFEDKWNDIENSMSVTQRIASDLNEVNNKILKIEREEEISQDNKNFENLKDKYIMRDVISDKETSIDHLNREIYINPISKLITNLHVESPLTIGVFGDWGSGKSSFLKLIEKTLKKLSSENKINCKTHIVSFDASEYNEEEKIWYSLLNQIFIAFEKDKPFFGKIGFLIKKFVSSFKQNILFQTLQS